MLHSIEPRSLKVPGRASSLSLKDITAQAGGLPDFDRHEQVWLGRDESRGLTAIVAVHDTTLGPALGGTRVWPHESFEAGLTDALRLSRGMTYKAAIAGLDLGGGKAVIIADPKTQKTPELLQAYAEMLRALDGQFYTGEDVGLTLEDADFLRARTPNVTGTTSGGSGNPSPVTAHGVFLGIKAALRHRRGKDRLAGIRVAVQGLGSVGWSLAKKLSQEGAFLTVSDIDPARAQKAVDHLGARSVLGNAILEADVDVLAPCALGGILSQETIPLLKASIVAGAANNQLATDRDDNLLRARGILYAPDYVINSGGLMNVAAELAPGGYDADATMKRVARIPETLTAIFRRAEEEGKTTEEVAEAMAGERLARGRNRGTTRVRR
ncbi:Glu/Leu/Phe/Val dehydrogenase dimerization domain-containing protein [Aquibium sp. LZ166]|uniref:Glu/Leu/Phe/Val dehydrogenase dimerization domain-containing protein n=1 Tax=Aquibium pacificus TaxID=3153579 RepID=A0ABV3SHL6_9HYPH